MLSRRTQLALGLALVAAIAAVFFATPQGAANKNRLSPLPRHTTVQPGELMKIVPAEAGRDGTDRHMIVGDQSAD